MIISAAPVVSILISRGKVSFSPRDAAIVLSTIVGVLFLIGLGVPVVALFLNLISGAARPEHTDARPREWSADFTAYCEERFAPLLAGLETSRMWHRRALIAAIAIVLALFVFALIKRTSLTSRLWVLALLPVIIVLAKYLYARQLKRSIIPVICDFFKEDRLSYLTFSLNGRLDGSAQDARNEALFSAARNAASLLHGFDGLILDDGFTGTRKGCRFLAAELTLTRGSGKAQESVFRGLVLGISGLDHFPSGLVVIREQGNAPLCDLERIKLEDVVFERDFDSYGTDQITARSLLQPSRMERITKAARGINAFTDSIEIPEMVFADDSFFIFIPTGRNWFELNGIMTSVYDMDGIKSVVSDIMILLELTDVLIGEGIVKLAGDSKNKPRETEGTAPDGPEIKQGQVFKPDPVFEPESHSIFKPHASFEDFES
jgi:biotin transporter BioY